MARKNPVCTLLLSAVGVWLALSHATAQELFSTNSVTPARLPRLVLRDIEGNYLCLSDVCYEGEEQPRKPKWVVVLNFMSVNCPPCKREMPTFLEIARTKKSDGVRSFLVSWDRLSDSDKLATYVKEMNVDCDVLLDPYQIAGDKLGVDSVPRTFVVSRDGSIVGDIAGATPDFEQRLKAAIQRALN
ncbi:MAG: TlpA family protein disulfide reductase [Lentisphaerae bacterium]|nr:TlpA family protein disulfide reductase [Lentisphaerota bacterium]